RLQRPDQVRTTNPRMLEVFIPEQQIANRGEQASSANYVLDRSLLHPCVARASVCQSAIRRQGAKIIAPASVRHAQRGENVLLRERLKRFAITESALNQNRCDVIADVCVAVVGAGVEVETALLGGHFKQVPIAVHVGAFGKSSEISDRAPVAKSADVAEHVTDGKRSAVIRQLR